MATEAQPTIALEHDHLHITNLKITDQTVIEYLESLEQQPEDVIEHLLRVGVTTMEIAETSKQEEFVERKFESMASDLETEIEQVQSEVEETFGSDGTLSDTLEAHLGPDGQLRAHFDDVFGEGGAFADRLDEELGEDGQRIQEALDPDREGTPTYRLKQHLMDEIEGIRDKLSEEAGAAEIRQRTTLKGEDFEDTIANILTDFVMHTPHDFAYTGEKSGELGSAKTGDFVLSLGDGDHRIVIEAKSDQSYSTPDIKDELDRARENRDGDVAVMVFESREQIPDKIGFFHEFDPERLVVAMAGDDDTDVEPAFFQFAMSWAQTRARQVSAETGTDFDPAAVQSNLEEVQAQIERFKTIRRKTTDIKSTANSIDEELDDIQDNVLDELSKTRRQIESTSST